MIHYTSGLNLYIQFYHEEVLCEDIIKELNRAEALREVGLNYLQVGRMYQLYQEVKGRDLNLLLNSVVVFNMLYILDEPTSGLHAGDTQNY